MTRDRGIGSIDNREVETAVRAEYESRWPFDEWDFIFADEYVTGNLFRDVPKSGGTANILIRNPEMSDHFIIVSKQFTTDKKTEITSCINADVSDVGTSTEVVQRRSDFGNGSDTIATLDATYTKVSETKQLPTIVIGSGKRSGGQLQNTAIMVAPGHNALFEATNVTTSTLDVTIELKITEVPRDVVDTLTQSQ